MHHPDQAQPASISEERVEIVDLDVAYHETQAQLAPVRTGQWLSRPLRRFAFVRRRRVQVSATMTILLAALIVLLGVNSGFSWLAVRIASPSSSPPAKQPYSSYPTKSEPQQDGMACLTSAAWSPDGRLVAVLGYRNYCPAYQSEPPPGMVNVYEAASHKLLEQIPLDPIVAAALKHSSSSGARTLVIEYEWVRWSPGGQELAVPFFVYKSSGETDAGLLLLYNQGQRILLQQVHPTNQLITYPYYFEWDLKRGTVSTIYNEAVAPVSATSLISIPPAPGYRWNAGGILEPASTPASSAGPVGNPDGGAAFTIWQPGIASKYTLSNGAHLVSSTTWSTTFMSWSPDGRYLIDQAATSALVILPHQTLPSFADPAALRLDLMGMLSARDKALARVLAALPASDQSLSSITLAWRPDGRELAAYNGGNIVVYDCATGREQAHITPSNIPVGLSGSDTLAWSPDGSHLLLSSITWGILNIWGPGQLPG